MGTVLPQLGSQTMAPPREQIHAREVLDGSAFGTILEPSVEEWGGRHTTFQQNGVRIVHRFYHTADFGHTALGYLRDPLL